VSLIHGGDPGPLRELTSRRTLLLKLRRRVFRKGCGGRVEIKELSYALVQANVRISMLHKAWLSRARSGLSPTYRTTCLTRLHVALHAETSAKCADRTHCTHRLVIAF